MERLSGVSVEFAVPLREDQRLRAYDALIPAWGTMVLASGGALVDGHVGDVL